MVTIKDIAEKAGVSRGTVDRVLNNRGKVAPEKKERIQRIAEEMLYQPNLAGKGLAARKKQLKLGFVYPDMLDMAPFFIPVREGALRYAEDLKQYSVEVHFFSWTIESLDNGEFLKSISENLNMDGWASDGIAGKYLRDALVRDGKQDVPIVCFNMDIAKEDRLAFVGCNYIKAGRLAAGVAALMSNEKGYIGIVSQDDGQFTSSMFRIQGFEEEICENYPNMKVVAKQFMNADLDQFDFFLKVQKMIAENQELDILYLVNPGDYSICQAILKASEHHKIRIITNDLLFEKQIDMVKNGQIAAVICQEPEKQGAKPLEILFNYLALGLKPENDWFETELSVLIRQIV